MAFQLRAMTPGDIPAGMRLKEIAGWNQTRGDWERFLEASPGGCFVAEVNSRVAGTVATIAYAGRFAWIGMVLVDPASRGQGIGTRLLEKAIAHLDATGIPSLKLDATPQGKPLYQKLGFVTEYEIERWELQREPTASAPGPAYAALEDVLRQDPEVFGADRSAVLRSLAAEFPDLVLQTPSTGKPAGYSLGRRGALAGHLGPWTAHHEDAGRDLLGQFLARAGCRRIFVDVVKSNPWATRLLRERGFQLSRPLTRMYRGRNDFPGRPDLQAAILGPEFG